MYVDGLILVRKSYPNNLMIGYLNTDMVRHKMLNLFEVPAKAPLNIFCIDEMKLDQSFPDAH